MALTLANKTCLTFSKISALYRITSGLGRVRNKSVKNQFQDLRPEHEEAIHPDSVSKKPGNWKQYTDLTYFHNQKGKPKKNDVFDSEQLTKYLEQMNIQIESNDDMPVDMPDPFQKPSKTCLLCQHNIKLDYKNTQLLSQFISPYTGRMYGRHVTGLCLHMQRRVAREVRIAKLMGFLPFMNKPVKYLEDPMLFNPFSRKT